jgi:pyruvate formate lyase activating enzyme
LTIDRARIRDYNKFRNICPARALVVTGEEKSVDDIIFEIEKDSLFYLNDQGGVTFTGGEPFFQDDLLFELAKEIKIRGIHLAVETCLHVPWKKFEKFIGIVDTFLVDIKHTDPQKFKEFTGGELSLVNENLDRLNRNNCQITGRIPVIPSFNFSEKELMSIVDHILNFRNIHAINFIPYHLLGREKYNMLDM